MPKTIEVREVLGAKDYSNLADPEAVAELDHELKDEGFGTYMTLGQLVAAEQRAKRQAEGYGNVTGRKVTDRMVRQALRRAAGQ